jgi:hypothetical protein
MSFHAGQGTRAGEWYARPNAANNAADYAKFFRLSHNAVIRVDDDVCNLIHTHEHRGDFERVVQAHLIA